MTDVLVIGGGASGLTAAIAAARRGKRVTVAECADRVGKKILASGNGRCNLAARATAADAYNTAFADAVLARVSERDVEAFFTGLGLLLRAEDGRVYPYDELSSSVLGVLRREAERLGVEIRTNTAVTELAALPRGGYAAAGMEARAVIVATGSPATFGRDSLALARGLGLSVRPFRPALCPLLCDPAEVRGLKGVRAKAAATLLAGETPLARERGEILFKDNGLSGIAIFNLSSRLARGARGTAVSLDFFPDLDAETLTRTLTAHGFAGVCHKELARNVVMRAGASCAEQARALKNYRVGIRGLGSPALAQVMSGGVSTEELDDTCRAKRYPGLYFVGETVDADGLCGGYNLLWAWASGLRAGGSV